MIKLNTAVNYSSKRASTSVVNLDNYISIDNILQNKAGISSAVKLPPSNNDMGAYDPGHILVGNIRPYLKKIWFSDRSGGCSADVLNFEVNKGFDPKFVYYAMLRDDFFIHMMKGSKGSKMPRGDKNQILDFKIPDFDLPKQHKIASVLSVLDSKIDLNNKINTELEAMAKLIYDYWFVQFDFPNQNGKPYKSSGGKMVWSEELKREIPEGWEAVNLLEIADYTNGIACQKYRPMGGKSLPVIKIREMHNGFSGETELVREDIPKKVIVEDGDILFSWSASLEVQVWVGGRGGLNQHIFKVTSRKYPRSFYYFQLLDYVGHFRMMAENRKTTMGHITQDHLKQSRIVLPPQLIIEDLDKELKPMFDSIVLNKKQNIELTDLRDWLLPMLMNGQVNVAEAS